MIKSSKLSINFSNLGKQQTVSTVLDEYKLVTQFFVDYLWTQDKISRLIPRSITEQVDTWLSKRLIQCCAKQASGIVRGTRTKQQRRLWQYNKFIEEGKFKKARKLKAIIDSVQMTKPNVRSIEMELDSRFVKVNLNKDNSFDGWITLSSLGKKIKLELPIKRTKHFNNLFKHGHIRNGIRLSDSKVTLMFDLPEIEKKTSGDILGLDVGIKNVFTCSDKQRSSEDKHGWNLGKIQERLSRRKKGSKGFERTQSHRQNYINWSIKQLNLTNVKTLRIERIKYIRKGNRSSRFMAHWTYTIIFDKLEDYCSQYGVRVEKISPTYTSQRCSQCGWVRKNNRKGKQFKCTSCSYESDADLNASRNIVLELPAISRQQRLRHDNRLGFYWHVLVQEGIVPGAQIA